MSLNVKLLRKVKKHILEEPKRFAMEWWYGESEPGTVPRMFNAESTAPRCGTVACIAGWALVLSGQKPDTQRMDVQQSAMKLLGIEADGARKLFGAGWWPGKFEQRYDTCKTRRGKANVAAERIEHFIKTGE